MAARRQQQPQAGGQIGDIAPDATGAVEGERNLSHTLTGDRAEPPAVGATAGGGGGED